MCISNEDSDFKLKGGVIIIGSLLWQDSLNGKDSIRKIWRDEHLSSEQFQVKLPIRYGRFSKDNIYTMVFSKECEDESKLGVGYVKFFKKSPIKNWEELENEVQEMAKAEGMGEKWRNKSWCTMSILFNPNINERAKKTILKQWKKDRSKDFKEYHEDGEETILTENYTLNINWLKTVNPLEQDNIDELDFVICTATKFRHEKSSPIKKYPSIEELAEKIKTEESGDGKTRRYFSRNKENEITTFQDKKIEEMIKK